MFNIFLDGNMLTVCVCAMDPGMKLQTCRQVKVVMTSTWISVKLESMKVAFVHALLQLFLGSLVERPVVD